MENLLYYIMSYFVGFCCGAVGGFGYLYIRNNKNELSYNLAVIKEDVTTLHVKLDNLLNSAKNKE